MLSKLLVFSGLMALAVSLSLKTVPIISQTQEVNPDGSFQWSYESGDGTVQQQSGQVVLLRSGEESENVQGSAAWFDPEGKPHQLSYVADEGGYKPQSEDLPVGPPLPPLIARALKWIEEHPPSPK